MKKSDLKDLLLRSLTEDISSGERKALEDKIIPDHGFGPDFSSKVMARIDGGALSVMRNDLFAGMDNTFLRLALTGAAAIVILAVSIFVSQGSLSYDALLGLDNSVDEGLISLLIK